MTTKTAQKAVELFDSGYNCSESVLLALSEEFAQKNPIIPRVATGFGGGVGRSGSICGALSGAVMAVGLLRGCDKAEEKEKRTAAYKSVLRMVDAFEKEFENINCKALTQCDFRTKEEQEKFRSKRFGKISAQNLFVGAQNTLRKNIDDAEKTLMCYYAT
jgi:C_GCAxxG_C_C family probable redox protein